MYDMRILNSCYWESPELCGRVLIYMPVVLPLVLIEKSTYVTELEMKIV